MRAQGGQAPCHLRHRREEGATWLALPGVKLSAPAAACGMHCRGASCFAFLFSSQADTCRAGQAQEDIEVSPRVNFFISAQFVSNLKDCTKPHRAALSGNNKQQHKIYARDIFNQMLSW